MKLFSYVALAAVCTLGVNALAEEEKAAKKVSTVHDLKMTSLEGKEVDLSKYKGKVLLMVNVASRCGATPQYAPLQKLHEKYADQGLVVMGFPCNQFGFQEPGDSKQIKEFCSTQYSVKFPMFEKLEVNGPGQSDLYSFLKSSADDHSDIGWNFEKFLVSKEGKVIARFKTRTQPDAPEVVKMIEEQLGN
ncbi:MAG: glutathione peroxidase [Planctomycetaceae bacterium]|nr:glutathione peroxidase [Planctomycetaceae bacterium]